MYVSKSFGEILNTTLMVLSFAFLRFEVFAYALQESGSYEFWTWEIALLLIILTTSVINLFDKE